MEKSLGNQEINSVYSGTAVETQYAYCALHKDVALSGRAFSCFALCFFSQRAGQRRYPERKE